MFIIETQNGKTFTTSGEFKPSMMVGPGGFNAKVWKTEAGAAQFATRWAARPGFAKVKMLEDEA